MKALLNSVIASVGGALFISAIMTSDWLEGRYEDWSRNKQQSNIFIKSITNSVNKTIPRFSIYSVVRTKYSLNELCASLTFTHTPLSHHFLPLKSNISRYCRQKSRQECFAFSDLAHLQDFAKVEIKRFKQVFIYLTCTVGLIGVAITFSIGGGLIPGGSRKTIFHHTSFGFALLASVCGFISVLVARVERQSERVHRAHGEWWYGVSFKLSCSGEAMLVLLVVANILQYYLQTRKRVAEEANTLIALEEVPFSDTIT